MSVSPTISLKKLGRLRNRERLYLLMWGVTKWLAFVLAFLTVALVADWWIDKHRETPMWVRVPLTILQAVAYAATFFVWVIRPAAKGPSLIKLAKRVEENIPEFDHRLITAIQLSRVGALTQGMSAELIGIVTEEAEAISERHDLVRLADTRRLKWSAALLAWPLGILAFLLLFFGPSLLVVLLQRQFLIQAEIPRDVHLKTVTQKLWPAGDEVVVQYEVTSAEGRIDKEMAGRVFVNVPDQPLAEYDLAYEKSLAENKAIFSAKIPHSSIGFRYRAKIGDGRSKGWDEVQFEPRPTITIYSAWVSMPSYVPLKPDGTRYEIEERNGDVKGFNLARARVRIFVQKEISDAALILYVRGKDGISEEPLAKRIAPDSLGSETTPEGTTNYTADFSFDLSLSEKEPRPIAYRVTATDKFGFVSLDNPRRSIEITEPDAPYIGLLPERFPIPGLHITEDDVLEGMPIPLKGSVPIEFYLRSPIGVPDPKPGLQNRFKSPARLVYKINDGPENRQYLDETMETAESGPYDIQKASFANLAFMQKLLKDDGSGVEFHGIPSQNPEREIPRREGGGHLRFNTKSLLKKNADGKDAELEIGDKIEFFVEVEDRRGQIGRSEPRIKEIQPVDEVIRRGIETVNSETRLRDLEKRQQGVFARPKN